MNELPPHLAERLLARARSAAPAPGERARVLAGLEQRILAGAVVDPRLSEAPFRAARRVSGANVGATTSSRALTVLRWASFGVVMTALGYYWGRRDGEAAGDASPIARVGPPASAAPVAAPTSMVALPASSAAPAPPPASPPQPSPVRAEEPVSPLPPPRAVEAKPRAPGPRAANASATRDDVLTLAQALELVRRAEAELRRGDTSAARVLLGELDRRAPARLLREERLATRALAACLDGDVSSAQRYTAELIAENPSSIYRGRLEGTCATERGEKR